MPRLNYDMHNCYGYTLSASLNDMRGQLLLIKGAELTNQIDSPSQGKM